MLKCPVCRGDGELISERLVGYDKKNKPIYIRETFQCSHCHGSGEIEGSLWEYEKEELK